MEQEGEKEEGETGRERSKKQRGENETPEIEKKFHTK